MGAGDKSFGGLSKSRVDQASQRQIDTALNDLSSVPLVNGMLVENIQLTSAANVDFIVSHGLKRAVRGFVLAKSDTAVQLYLSPSNNPTPHLQTILRAAYSSGSPKISVWFF